MRLLSYLLLLSATLLASAARPLPAAEPRVEFELANPTANSQFLAQQWYKVLTDLKVAGLRIRQARADDRPDVVLQGSAAQPAYKVTGVLTARNELELPGGRFSLRDQGALAGWIKRLKEEGPPGSPRKKVPFGLEPKQLEQLNDALAQPVDLETKGLGRQETIAAIARQTGLSLAIEPGGEAALAAAGPTRESFRGLACGTSLAAVVRSAGLAVMPRIGRAKGLQLVITRPASGAEIWPIGFPAEDQRQKLVPRLFDVIEVQIDGNPLNQALEAVASRLEIPFLLDHQALAAEKIDPEKEIVALPAKKLSYSLILRMLLSQAKLEGQLRTDDAGKPFFWITTFRQAAK